MALPMISHAQQVEKSELQKMYIEPSQLAFDIHGIFALVGGQWIPVDSISTDAMGLYATYRNPNHGRWRCPRCMFSNDPWEDFCQNYVGNRLCLTPRPQ